MSNIPGSMEQKGAFSTEEGYRYLIQQSSEGIWRIELDHPVRIDLPEDQQIDACFENAYLAECNDAMAKMYGFSEAKELLGIRLGQLLPRSERASIEFIRAFIRSGYSLTDAESSELDKDGNRKYFLNNFVAVVADGAIIRAWGTQRDITRSKNAEDEIRKINDALTQADRKKDEFLAVLAHELRNPLSAISNAIQLMRRPNIEAQHLEWCKDMAQRQIKQLARLVDDLLDVSRISRGKLQLKLQRIDASPVLASAIESVRSSIEEKGHTLRTSYTPCELPLCADPARVEQIIVNLLSNAVKFTEPGGEIFVRAVHEGNETIISIRDTGEGITPEHIPQLFELFVQGERSHRGEGGLGIGLTLVKKLSEMQGGTVVATSGGPGTGSEFTVRLPAVEIPAIME